MNRRDALKVFTLGGTLTAAAAEASRALGDMPEERDLGGCTRLVRIYVAGDDALKGTPIIAIESVDMFPIELVTKIEMELDAKDMVFHGYMTRIAHDEFSRDAQGAPWLRPCKKQTLVREPFVVHKFVVMDKAAGPYLIKPRPADLAYPLNPQRGAS
jgi:hypothetical protein